MSPSENKEIVLRKWYQELWDRWNIGVADDLFSSDYALHLSGVDAALNRDAAKQVVAMFSVAFPDLKHTVDEIIAEGETIAARWTVRGTHRGEYQGIAPTGRNVTVSGTTIHHMSSGRIVETWLTMDTIEVLKQLDAVPQVARA
jgi:steroid delta-isomerase-like uncharacterized protein